MEKWETNLLMTFEKGRSNIDLPSPDIVKLSNITLVRKHFQRANRRNKGSSIGLLFQNEQKQVMGCVIGKPLENKFGQQLEILSTDGTKIHGTLEREAELKSWYMFTSEWKFTEGESTWFYKTKFRANNPGLDHNQIYVCDQDGKELAYFDPDLTLGSNIMDMDMTIIARVDQSPVWKRIFGLKPNNIGIQVENIDFNSKILLTSLILCYIDAVQTSINAASSP